MGTLEVKTYPDPCLRVKTRPVEMFDDDLSEIVRSMAELMYVSQGIGLAATQVGLGISLLVMDVEDGLVSMVNPVILERSHKKSGMEEGCLSLPGITVNVSRPETVKVRAQDVRGKFFMKTYEGLEAKVVQHEMDHLRGRLLIDYLDPVRRFLSVRKLSSSRREQDVKTCEVTCNVRR